MTKADIAKKRVKEYLNEYLNDNRSYLPAVWGSLISNYYEFDDTEQGTALNKSLFEVKEKQAVYDRMMKNGGNDSAEYAPFRCANKHVLDSLQKVYNTLKKQHKRFLTGYTLRHKFRAKNAMGGYMVYEYIFYFDRDLLVVDVNVL